MDGMDMSNDGMVGIGSDTNHRFARDYWYICAGVVAGLAAIRGVNHIGAVQRLKASRDPSIIPHPTRPDGPLSQAWATTTALVREIGHPQLFVSIRGLSWATPPSLGRVLVLLAYWAMIIYFMTWNAIIKDVYFWERIGYRNAWVSLTQLPMMFLLANKVNIVGFLIGSSHERLNWLHRWVARTMFVTVTVHGFHFWTEWVRADFVALELSIMPMVKYGLGAWGILLWNVVTGFVPIRSLAYELWVLQHVASSVVMLVLVYLHIPTNARYLFWMTVSFVVFDRLARWALLLWQNLRFKAGGSPCQARRRIGHQVMARAVGDLTTVVTIKDVHMKWTAGQHIYLWIPRLGLLEAHPYTIACARPLKGTCCCNSVQLIIRKHGGFSKRIHAFASKSPEATLTGFLSGPYGAPPRWDIYDTMVLIGASTGASFTLPILESAAQAESTACVKRIEVVLMARTVQEIDYYIERAREAGSRLREKGVDVRFHIAVTGSSLGEGLPLIRNRFSSTRASTASLASTAADEEPTKPAENKPCCCEKTKQPDASASGLNNYRNSTCSMPESVREYTARPDIAALIREPIEQAWGETAVVVCGGRELVARTRNCVSRLSDERAVQRGTGAQGIYLYAEEYAF